MEEVYQIASQTAWIIPGMFLLITAIQLFYYWFFFSRVAFFKHKPPAFSYPPVSVVICARNEFTNLEENLPLILSQDYPHFEVVVVDDGSDDESNYLLQDLCKQYPLLRVVSLRPNINFFKGKKFPLSMGIKSAKHELLLLTDADCRPASDQWIKNMTRHFNGAPRVILGYGAYQHLPGFLNKLIRFDTLWVALQYLSLALAGLPYMGVGRNLSYHRQLFYKVKGFTSHYKVMSGDDDLFVNQVANAGNLSVEISPESHTISVPKKTFSSWFRQKSRHMTTGTYYKKKHQWLLGIFGISQLLFYPLLVAALLLAPSDLILLIIAAAFVVRTLCLMIIVKYVSGRLNEPKLFLYSPLLDGIMTLLNVMFSLSALLVKKNKWK